MLRKFKEIKAKYNAIRNYYNSILKVSSDTIAKRLKRKYPFLPTSLMVKPYAAWRTLCGLEYVSLNSPDAVEEMDIRISFRAMTWLCVDAKVNKGPFHNLLWAIFNPTEKINGVGCTEYVSNNKAILQAIDNEMPFVTILQMATLLGSLKVGQYQWYLEEARKLDNLFRSGKLSSGDKPLYSTPTPLKRMQAVYQFKTHWKTFARIHNLED